eukprot:1154067-Pelagomonas_calceolata.AAC.7
MSDACAFASQIQCKPNTAHGSRPEGSTCLHACTFCVVCAVHGFVCALYLLCMDLPVHCFCYAVHFVFAVSMKADQSAGLPAWDPKRAAP